MVSLSCFVAYRYTSKLILPLDSLTCGDERARMRITSTRVSAKINMATIASCFNITFLTLVANKKLAL